MKIRSTAFSDNVQNSQLFDDVLSSYSELSKSADDVLATVLNRMHYFTTSA